MPPPSPPEGGVPRHPSHYASLRGLLQSVVASSLSIPAALVLITILLGCIRWAVLQHLSRKRRKFKVIPIPPQEKHPAPPPLPSVTFKPIYPWTSPPQPLPGPYDPRLYPAPTIRRHSYPDHANPPPEADAEITTTVSYSRRVSTNSIPARQFVLQGTLTTASTGWRRSHWVVGAG